MKSIKNVSQINEVLARIAELDVGISDADNNALEIINQAKVKAEETSRPLIEEREALVQQLKNYSDSHREELYLDGKQSADFTNGTIGYRQNPDSIEVSKETADLLEKAGFANCVKVKKEPVKAALKGFSDDDLSKFGASRIPGKESFYVKASEVCVKATPKGAA